MSLAALLNAPYACLCTPVPSTIPPENSQALGAAAGSSLKMNHTYMLTNFMSRAIWTDWRRNVACCFFMGAPIASLGGSLQKPYSVIQTSGVFISPNHSFGRGDNWGTLEAGKAADALVVDGDPARDVFVLMVKGRIQAIIQNGVFRKNTIPGGA